MLISKLSEKSGFSIDTIRFYEKIGILDVSRVVRKTNNYKNYKDVDLERLLAVRDLKDLGFTLKEVQVTISRYLKDPLGCSKNVPILRAKLGVIDTKIAHLIALRKKLKKTERDCEKNCKNCCELNRTLQRII
ncbi:MAG: MerR family transcriptional regulator [bacterium]|nr:MerR family transcriptional regulator [bacterium]